MNAPSKVGISYIRAIVPEVTQPRVRYKLLPTSRYSGSVPHSLDFQTFGPYLKTRNPRCDMTDISGSTWSHSRSGTMQSELPTYLGT